MRRSDGCRTTTIYVTAMDAERIGALRGQLHDRLVQAGHREVSQPAPKDSEVLSYALAIAVNAEDEFIKHNGRRGWRVSASLPDRRTKEERAKR